jgi:hypothetical protein
MRLRLPSTMTRGFQCWTLCLGTLAKLMMVRTSPLFPWKAAAAAPEANQIAARSGFRVLDGVPLERARWIGHMGSNDNKISDGCRERAPIELEVC